jgi:hypothetical protein
MSGRHPTVKGIAISNKAMSANNIRINHFPKFPIPPPSTSRAEYQSTRTTR